MRIGKQPYQFPRREIIFWRIRGLSNSASACLNLSTQEVILCEEVLLEISSQACDAILSSDTLVRFRYLQFYYKCTQLEIKNKRDMGKATRNYPLYRIFYRVIPILLPQLFTKEEGWTGSLQVWLIRRKYASEVMHIQFATTAEKNHERDVEEGMNEQKSMHFVDTADLSVVVYKHLVHTSQST